MGIRRNREAMLLLVVVACLSWRGAGWAAGPRLGPKDESAGPPTDLERVRVGEAAPDFILEDQDGTPVTLSAFRGEKDVVLVFYRGHW